MIDEIINDSLNCNHIHSIPITELTTDELIELSKKAKKNHLLISLKAEHSNFYQGVLVRLLKNQ